MEAYQLTLQVYKFIKLSSFAGFIVTAVLVVNFNRIALGRLFGENSKITRWLIIFTAAISLMIIIYIFSFLFESRQSNAI